MGVPFQEAAPDQVAAMEAAWKIAATAWMGTALKMEVGWHILVGKPAGEEAPTQAAKAVHPVQEAAPDKVAAMEAALKIAATAWMGTAL